MIYEIAGLKVEMQPQFDRLKRQSETYISSGEPVITLNPDLYGKINSTLVNRTDEDIEYIYSSAEFCREIIRHGRFFLHASAVVYKDEAYLFSAPSGVGKSTHTSLWLKEFSGSYILNDDKPVILPKKDSVSVFGTPFSGKSDLNVNTSAELAGICFIEQSPDNSIERIDPDSALPLMISQTIRPSNPERMIMLCDFLDELLREVPVYRLKCNVSTEAAELSYNTMSRKLL